MTTNINNSQGIAVGDNAKVEGNTFQQLNSSLPQDFNYLGLAEELNRVKIFMKAHADTPEQYAALSQIALAEEEAKNKNGSKIVEFLRSSGKWVFEVATKIGVSLVTEVLKTHISST